MTTEQDGAEAPVVENEKLPEGNEEVKELTPVEKELADAKAQLEKDASLLKKLRKYERENKEAAEKALAEQGKFRELYEAERAAREAIENKVKARELDNAIKQALVNFKAKAPDTVLKLIDKSAIQWNEDGTPEGKSIERALKELKNTDPILFAEETVATPPVKRPGEGTPVGGVQEEMRTAKTIDEVYAIMAKYKK